MIMNRKAQTQNMIMWIVVLGVVAYMFNFGGFQDTVNGFLTPQNNAGGLDINDFTTCPTDGTTTFTLNVQDALTSTATNVDVEYFVFNGNKLIKEGTTGADGAVDIDVACGKDYQILLINTTTEDGSYPVIRKLEARISEDTINVQVTRFGTGKILGIENPSDPSRNSNITLTAGATGSFELKFKANQTDQGFNRPIIMCEARITNITDISIGSFSDGTPVKELITLPKRISATAGYQFYAWEYGKMLTPKDGVITASGSIVASNTADAVDSEEMLCRMIDQATWKVANYKIVTSIEEGFPQGPENTESLADVGGPDSSVTNMTFSHSGGF